MISIHHGDNDNLDYTFSLVLVTKIRDVNSTWPLCDKGEFPAAQACLKFCNFFLIVPESVESHTPRVFTLSLIHLKSFSGHNFSSLSAFAPIHSTSVFL